MSNLGLAIGMAAEVHANQTDKAGEEYILHCLAVMDMVEEYGKDAMIVAVLHDSFEDHSGSPKEVAAFQHRVLKEFGQEIFDAIYALSHPGNRYEPYDEYIERVKGNYLARIVKIADLTHNMDPRRIPASQIVDKDFSRWDKYRRALIELERR